MLAPEVTAFPTMPLCQPQYLLQEDFHGIGQNVDVSSGPVSLAGQGEVMVSCLH